MRNKIILTFGLCFVLVDFTLGQYHPFCLNPSNDPYLDAQFIKDNIPTTGAYILYGNKVARQHWSQYLQGKQLNPNEDFSQLCAKARYHKDRNVADQSGFGNLAADVNCAGAPGGRGGFDCTFTSQINPYYADVARAYIPFVDKKDLRSFHIVVFCYQNGETGWIVDTIKRRRITDEDKATIVAQVKSIGFDPEDIVEMYTDACGN